MYAWYFLFWRSKSPRGHFRFWARKLQEFIFPQLGTVENFNLNWDNPFFSRTCVVFLIQIEGHSGGQKVKFVFQLVKKYQIFQIAKIKVSSCSTWTEKQKSSQ